MVQLFLNILKSIRPRQALKNFALFAPIVFSGNLFNDEKLIGTIYAFFIFSMMTSAVYLINDIIDLPKDKYHPFKKKRPIASGALPVPIALFVALVAIVISLTLSISANYFFFLTIIAYFALQTMYSLALKNMIILDVISIAAGFILRVYAGAIAVNVHMNVWFLLCVISLSLFLAVGKRRAEMAILDKANIGQHRATLSVYTPQLLDSYLTMFANSAWMSYALFTFFTASASAIKRPEIFLAMPLTLAGIDKWLMATIPIAIYGIMRYLAIIYRGSSAESPERVLLSDKPILISVIVWGLAVILIIYGGK